MQAKAPLPYIKYDTGDPGEVVNLNCCNKLVSLIDPNVAHIFNIIKKLNQECIQMLKIELTIF